MSIPLFNYINNYKLIFLAKSSEVFNRGKYYRKKIFDVKRILNKNYPQKENFKFVQVGANDGISFDFLYHFVISRKSSGIVIEPISEYFDELLENYKEERNIIKVCAAVHKSLRSVEIYKIDRTMFHLYPDWVKGIASFNKSHLTKFNIINPEHIVSERVDSYPLMSIIDTEMYYEIDYFQVDTEGYDFEVINMIDFKKITPKVIKAEYINLTDVEKVKMKNRLKTNGYFVFNQGLDLVGVDLKQIKL